jgi:uncharacterized phage protein gp47/JayE
MAERKFQVYQRGHFRDNVILTDFRNRLRAQNNPETGLPFTEDEIFRATQPGTYFYIQADAIDLMGMTQQAQALLLSRQIRPSQANTIFLEQVHAPQWLGTTDARLSATGASGNVSAPASPGTIFVGSTTIPDATAAVATDPNGYRYQVLQTVVTPAGGAADLQVQAIDTGTATNIADGTVLTWSANKPLGAEAEATVGTNSAAQLTGGFEQETDTELGSRIEDIISNRPAAGNQAHFVAWARESSVAIEYAFVYPCAFHAGSVLVCILEKRGTEEGPLARTDVSVGTYLAAKNYLTPPDSPVLPNRAYVVVTKANSQPADMVLRVAMAQGTSGAWADSEPWPNPDSATTLYPAVEITSVTSQTDFDVTTDQALPGGAASLSGTAAPQMMVWKESTSEFIQMSIDTVTNLTPTTYNITLTQPTSGITIATGLRISPYTDREPTISDAIGDYFDGLGPGQLVNLSTDPRASRAYRYPPTNERYNSRAGQAIISTIIDALGEAASDASLEEISRNEPDLPGDIIDGPNIVTLGNVAVYPL